MGRRKNRKGGENGAGGPEQSAGFGRASASPPQASSSYYYGLALNGQGPSPPGSHPTNSNVFVAPSAFVAPAPPVPGPAGYAREVPTMQGAPTPSPQVFGRTDAAPSAFVAPVPQVVGRTGYAREVPTVQAAPTPSPQVFGRTYAAPSAFVAPVPQVVGRTGYAREVPTVQAAASPSPQIFGRAYAAPSAFVAPASQVVGRTGYAREVPTGQAAPAPQLFGRTGYAREVEHSVAHTGFAVVERTSYVVPPSPYSRSGRRYPDAVVRRIFHFVLVQAPILRLSSEPWEESEQRAAEWATYAEILRKPWTGPLRRSVGLRHPWSWLGRDPGSLGTDGSHPVGDYVDDEVREAVTVFQLVCKAWSVVAAPYRWQTRSFSILEGGEQTALARIKGAHHVDHLQHLEVHAMMTPSEGGQEKMLLPHFKSLAARSFQLTSLGLDGRTTPWLGSIVDNLPQGAGQLLELHIILNLHVSSKLTPRSSATQRAVDACAIVERCINLRHLHAYSCHMETIASMLGMFGENEEPYFDFSTGTASTIAIFTAVAKLSSLESLFLSRFEASVLDSSEPGPFDALWALPRLAHVELYHFSSTTTEIVLERVAERLAPSLRYLAISCVPDTKHPDFKRPPRHDLPKPVARAVLFPRLEYLELMDVRVGVGKPRPRAWNAIECSPQLEHLVLHGFNWDPPANVAGQPRQAAYNDPEPRLARKVMNGKVKMVHLATPLKQLRCAHFEINQWKESGVRVVLEVQQSKVGAPREIAMGFVESQIRPEAWLA